jgi:hypothetical protein
LLSSGRQSKEERNRFAYDIPGVTKELRWANVEYEKAVRRQAGASNDDEVATTGRGARRGSYRYLAREFDRRGLEAYRNYLQKQNAEQREERLQMELALREREEAQKRDNEEKRRTQIADVAVREYKSQMEEQEMKVEQERKLLEDGLQKMLTKVGVEDDKIDQVLKEAAPLRSLKTLFSSSVEGPIDPQPDSEHKDTPIASVEPKSIFSRYCINPTFRHATYLSKENQDLSASTACTP